MSGDQAPRRRRQTGVRDRVLSLLAEGPSTNSALQKKGKFTHSALYLNIKRLRSEGLVVSERRGRSVILRLKGERLSAVNEPIEAEVVNVTKSKASSALATRVLSPELHEALGALAHRLSPVARAEEKLLVLDQLARTLPPAVAEVLRDVMDDLVRIAAFRA